MSYTLKDCGFKTVGEFYQAVKRQCLGEADYGKRLKAMTEGTDSQGGFLVPEEAADEIFSVALGEGIVRQRARLLTASSDVLIVPTLVDTNRGTNVFGGVTFAWYAEAADNSADQSAPMLGQVRFTIKEGIASCLISNQLGDDARNFGAFFRDVFGRAVAIYGDYYFINGNGVNQPLGILGSPALLSLPRKQDNLITWDDIRVMANRLFPASHQSDSTVWLLNQSALDQIMVLGSRESDLRNVVDLNAKKLIGFPYIITEVCPALGTAGDIILADLSYYAIADRELSVSASRDVPTNWQANKTVWKLVIRLDGQPTYSVPITPKYGGSTIAAFITLSAQTS